MLEDDVSQLAFARSFLFVPGHRPDRFAKAAAAGADVLIIDLEDAVPPSAKADARANALTWISSGNPGVVRVNGTGTMWHEDDVDCFKGVAQALMLPKAESREELKSLGGQLVIPLVETARGLLHAEELLSASNAVRPAFGSMDLSAELGTDPQDRAAQSWPRALLAVAAAAARTAPPVDGVTLDMRDDVMLAEDVRAATRLGLTAKLCIHPRQVSAVHELLRPGEDAVGWARNVVAQYDASDGVGVVDGQMIDPPVFARAQGILQRLEQYDRKADPRVS